ncbi:DinB family protein [Chloroflexota bacterium]
MEWQKLICDIYERISQVTEKALDGLDIGDLNEQPNPECNSMGWLTWHLTRVQDLAISGLTGEEQIWIKNKWYKIYNRPDDPRDFGLRHSPEDLAAFISPDVKIHMAYHHLVLEQTKRYISNLSESDLDKKIDHPVYPTVGAYVVGIISDNLQHVGQIAYVRGLLKGKGWLEL